VSLLVDLLAALPAGASEAVVSQGLDSVIERLRGGRDSDSALADELQAIASNEDPARPIAEISVDLSAALQRIEVRHSTIDQRAGDYGSQIAVGEVGGDLYVAHPRGPHRR
jgi:hypothetical protein